MSIETRTQQSGDDIRPEGREPDARQDVPSQVAYEKKVPDSPDDDALPLDGSLTLNDTEPEDQTQRQPVGPHLLSGSEAGGTANASIEGGADADAAMDSGDPATASATANADPSIG
jgi:hypothetical protein